MTPPPSKGTETLQTRRWKLQRFFTRSTRTIVSDSPALGVLATIFVVFAAVAFAGHHSIENTLREEQAKTLKGTLKAATAGVELWLEEKAVSAGILARDPAVQSVSKCLATRPALECDAAKLEQALSRFQLKRKSRFVIIDRDGKGLFSSEGEEFLKFLAPHLKALTQASIAKSDEEPRLLSPVNLKDGSPFSALFVPLGKRLLFGVEVPLDGLTRSLRAARTGRSGETYAIDREGRMISQTRFATHLRKAGLLGPNEEGSILRVEIRDPEVNLAAGERTGTHRSKQPLTKMARSVLSEGEGVDVSGYRDYRGVRVVGAWSWLAQYGFGVATELDEEEALQPILTVNLVYFLMLAVLGCICLGSLGVGIRATILRRKADAALARLERLGQYRIEKKIGEGGMGAVYLAHHEMLRRPTALKVMLAQRDNEDAFRRFELEAQATSELTHPNTVSIFDFGRAADGTFYYAMEYLDGMDLERLVAKEGPLAEARVLHFLYQAAGSLSEAHETGLIHRDIKPSNLLAAKVGGEADFLKVLDFGVAKATDLDGSRITRSSTTIGTPEYMSPEMFDRTAEVTSQSDLYSLGAVGYFLLTGHTMFPVTSMAELYVAHLSEPPVPPSQRAGKAFDTVLEDVILLCLMKDPERRPRGALALRAMLRRSPLFGVWGAQAATEVKDLVEPPVSGARNKDSSKKTAT